MARKAAGARAPLRVWVAGCSTGEEVYSLAIALLEWQRDEAHRPCAIQIFGSDVSERSIERARLGVYSEGALRDMDDERRRAYFSRVEDGYQVQKPVRELCVFARSDVTSDPPFSRLDCIICRNVICEFEEPLRRAALGLLHDCLAQPGFLVLGANETVGSSSHLFTPANKANGIFSRTATPSTLQPSFRREAAAASRIAGATRSKGGDARRADDAGRHLDLVLSSRYLPPALLVNEQLDILQSRGETQEYLGPGSPATSLNLGSTLPSGAVRSLHRAVAEAKSTLAPVRLADERLDWDDGTKRCDIAVLPFVGRTHAAEQLFVIVFEGSSRGGRPQAPRSRPAGVWGELAKTQQELVATKAHLQAMIEEHRQASDDLGAANDELISGNEELQRMNKALSAAREELESNTQELTTLNEELRSRHMEVREINADLVNLVDSVDIPIVIVDIQRRIRRFTPRARHTLNVTPADVGLSMDHIGPNIEVADLDARIAEVIGTMAVRQSEVRDREGRWYRMRNRPYRTTDNRIDGAVLSLVDIDQLKRHIAEAHAARGQAESANRAKDEFLANVSHELRTPFSAMLLHAQLLRSADFDPNNLSRAAEAIERGTRMQVRVIDDLLDVSRVVSGKFHLILQTIDLCAVVDASLETAAAQAKAKSIALEIALDRTIGAISGNPSACSRSFRTC